MTEARKQIKYEIKLFFYKSPCISFIKSAYASSLVSVSSTFGCETCCGIVSRVSGPEPAGRSLDLLLGWSRLTRNAVGMSFVNSACVFRNCGLALMVAVASLLIVTPVKFKVRQNQLCVFLVRELELTSLYL